MEEHLPHELGVDMEISMGGLDVLVSHHLFDLIDGASREEEILGVGMPEPVGRRRKPCLFHGFFNGPNHIFGTDRAVGELMNEEKVPGGTRRSCLAHV